MKIAIIGDIHSNLENLKNALTKVKDRDIEQVIVVGDLQNPEVIDIIGSTSMKFSIVFGNADYNEQEFVERALQFSNIQVFGKEGTLELGGRRIGFDHYPQTVSKMVHEGEYDVVFSGHRHSPWEEKIGKNKTLSICPGEIAGQRYRPTFCIFDLESMKPELILINS